MLELALVALIVLAALQPTDERMYVAFLFAGLSAAHHVILYKVDGIAYHGSAALIDFAVVMFSLRLRILSDAIMLLQNLCIASIFVNAMGWVAWMLYTPPAAYNITMLVLYVTAIIILLKRETRHDYGDNPVGVGGGYFRAFHNPRSDRSSKQ